MAEKRSGKTSLNHKEITIEELFVVNKENKKQQEFLKALANCFYVNPTLVQKRAIPDILKGNDCLLKSQTGSGKSLAFLIPAVLYLLDLDFLITERKKFLDSSLNTLITTERSRGTKVLIIAPTRELVQQLAQVAHKLTIPFPSIVVSSLTGGERRKSEKARLRKGVTILVSTVGRICDHLELTNSFKVTGLGMLVLDEGDRLLDMGFEKKLRWIVNTLKERWQNTEEFALFSSKSIKMLGNRWEMAPPFSGNVGSNRDFQVILVSATLSAVVKSLASFVLTKEAHWIIVNENDLTEKGTLENDPIKKGIVQNFCEPNLPFIPRTLTQYFAEVTLKTRLVLLISVILSKASSSKMVVFVSNCNTVDFLFAFLTTCRWPGEIYLKSRKQLRNTQENFSEIGFEDIEENTSHDKFTDFKLKADDKSRCLRKAKVLTSILGERIFKEIAIFRLHGSLTQQDRIGYLADFNKRESKCVLITTDVAARGLNLDKVTWIIQHEPAFQMEEYIHRVGRTARNGKTGNALLFLLDHERGYLKYLKGQGILLEQISELELLQPLIQEKTPDYIRSARLQNVCGFLLGALCRQVEADLDLLHFARKAHNSSYKAYRCHSKEMKLYFDSKKLHLGHLASSFGLNESPSIIGQKCKQGFVASDKRRKIRSELEPIATQNASVFGKIAGGILNDQIQPTAIAKHISTETTCRKKRKLQTTSGY